MTIDPQEILQLALNREGHPGSQLSPVEEAIYKHEVVTVCILRHFTSDADAQKVHESVRTPDGKPLFAWNSEKPVGVGTVVSITLPDFHIPVHGAEPQEAQTVHYRLAHAFRDGDSYWDKKTGFKAHAFEVIDAEGNPQHNTVKIFFPGSDFRKQDNMAVLRSVYGKMHEQVPVAGDYMRELLQQDFMQGKQLEIIGNSLGGQNAVMATAVARLSGVEELQTVLIDPFAARLAVQEVAKEFAALLPEQYAKHGFSKKDVDVHDVAKMLEGDMLTLLPFPASIASDPIPWLVVPPGYMLPSGRVIHMVNQMPEQLALAESLGAVPDGSGRRSNLVQQFKSSYVKHRGEDGTGGFVQALEAAANTMDDNTRNLIRGLEQYADLTHRLKGIAKNMLNPDAIRLVEAPPVDMERFIRDDPKTLVRRTQLHVHSAVAMLDGFVDLCKQALGHSKEEHTPIGKQLRALSQENEGKGR